MAEDKNNDQSIKGNNNKQAGGDINETTHHHYNDESPPLVFYADDIKEIILLLSEKIDDIKPVSDDFTRIDIELKNEKNKMSDEYFKFMQNDSLPYFKKIETFLKEPMNTEFSDLYNDIALDLRHAMAVRRDNYKKLELIFENIYGKILKRFGDKIKADRKLVLVLLHYMYWNCDIGKK